MFSSSAGLHALPASVKVESRVDGHDIELWQLGRKIQKFKHQPE
jgi:hypothetical protein